MPTTADIFTMIPTRGLLRNVCPETGIAVFSRVDSHKRRVFDIVDYSESEDGSQVDTFYGVKAAREYARNILGATF